MTDEELGRDLDAAARGERPPVFGELQFVIPGSPVSMQSKKASRDEFSERVCSSFSPIKYILIGDVLIEVWWYVSARDRYETDAGADIDNAIKPMLDAMCGPGGLLVDDCQIHHLHVTWSHTTEDERIAITLRYSPDDWYRSDDLCFLDLSGGLCVPTPLSLDHKGRKFWVETLNSRGEVKNRALELGLSYPWAATLQLSPRPFHRTRISGFPVFSPAEYVEAASSSASRAARPE